MGMIGDVLSVPGALILDIEADGHVYVKPRHILRKRQLVIGLPRMVPAQVVDENLITAIERR
jgi:hypothetical protein